MSKKLMMNNYSENGLVPVLDGLVCWLDGRDYVDNTGIWIDRSQNGNDITLTSKHYFYENGVYFDGSGISKEIIGADLGKAVSFEVIYKILSTGGLFSLGLKSAPTNNNSMFGVHLDSASFLEIRSTISTVCKFSGIIPNTINRNLFICSDSESSIYNDKMLVAKGYEKNTMGNNLTLGMTKAPANGQSKIVIYSVKIYNRALKEEEIAQNYLYEQSIQRGE